MSDRHGAHWPIVSRRHYNRDMDDLLEEVENERYRSETLEDAYRRQQRELAFARRSAQLAERRSQEAIWQAYQAGGQRGYQNGVARGQQEGYQYGLERGYGTALDRVRGASGGGYGCGSAQPGCRSGRHGGSGGGQGHRGRTSYAYEYVHRSADNSGLRGVGRRPSDYPFATNLPGETRGPQGGPARGDPPSMAGHGGRSGSRQTQMPGHPAQWHGRADTIAEDD